jgi:hypothetical protein
MNASRIKKVCYFHNPHARGRFHDYDIHTLDPAPYFLSKAAARRPFVRRMQLRKLGALQTAAGLDSLYRKRDSDYMRFVDDFIAEFEDADLVVLATYNPIHPEVLRQRLARPTRILGFIDDPHSTYVRGIPYLWSFDGAFYISPGYNEAHDFRTALAAWGCRDSYWFPLVPAKLPEFNPTDTFFETRDVEVVYIGGSYGSKTSRLAQFKQALGPRFRVHGRWALKGYIGFARGLLGKPVYPHRVTALSDTERRELYCSSKIGINMHLSDERAETGNMRMYEVPAHGAMLLCDKSARDMHATIFRPDYEAVFYDDLDDALDRIHYYLEHPRERTEIARRGFERVQREYTFDAVLKGLLDWAISVPRNR